jgi:cholera toxin transcriptional activator
LDEGHTQPRLFRFGMFELDAVSGELRKDGKSRPRIRDQALQILIVLLEKSDEVVGRDELRERLWPSDTFVDFDHGLNTAINQARTALGDSAANPKFIQTLPRRGYRFIGPVQIVARENAVAVGGENNDGYKQAAEVLTRTDAEMRSSILSDARDLPVVRRETVRILFSLIQLMYLIFYIIFLVRLSFAEAVLND